ncbi:organic cation transporter protein-like [Babylonia areolata]|uniref:organic cation transporter protein-like n=1 Tax=Babylonia areolata TaxID=304850 RepID=UPI003FD674FE
METLAEGCDVEATTEDLRHYDRRRRHRVSSKSRRQKTVPQIPAMASRAANVCLLLGNPVPLLLEIDQKLRQFKSRSAGRCHTLSRRSAMSRQNLDLSLNKTGVQRMEDLYQYLGEWGSFQTRVFVLLFLPIMSKGLQTMLAVIIFHVPRHRCQIPGWQGDTYAIQNEEHRLVVNQTIPMEHSDDSSYSQCSIFTRGNHSTVTNHSEESRQLQDCHAWVYDTSVVETSVISQFDLVCDQQTFRAHLNMAFILGLLCGGVLIGYLCDWFGRKTVFCISNVIGLAVGVASAFPPSVEVFLLYRCIMGALGSAIYMSAFVLVIELVGPAKRTKAASVLTIIWLVGPFLLDALSFLLRQWHYLQIVSVSPLVLCLGHWWLLPESPRWLLMKKKTKAALTVMQKVARVNKTSQSPSMETIVKLEQDLEAKGKGSTMTDNIKQLCRYPRMVAVTVIISFNWAVVSTTYYGLSLNVGNLGGSLRINFFVSSTVELIGYVLGWVLLDRLGRKRSHCCFMLTAGLACLATILTVSYEIDWLTTALAMLGKLGISASYTALYLISAEIFPTVIRNLGLACSSAWGRVGSLTSPYITDMALYVGGRFGRAVPLVIFGGLALLAGLSALYLPETLNRTLPDTLEDAVNFMKNGKTEKEKGPAKDCADEGKGQSSEQETTAAV